jgi:hypothetical protein
VRRESRLVAVALLGLLAAACGRQGSIRPPLILVPQAPEGVKVSQRGQSVVLEWDNPAVSIDGSPLLGIGGLEIWAAGRKEDIPAGAKLIKNLAGVELDALPGASAPGTRNCQYAFVPEGKDRLGKPLALALRVRDLRGKRVSAFSSAAVLTYLLAPGPPLGLRLEAAENRLSLSWTIPAANADGSVPAVVKAYNVYRAELGQSPARVNPRPIVGTAFVDAEFVYDKTYVYTVRASATDAEPFVESADAVPAELTPRDVYPPAVPTGLTAAAGGRVITLLWDAGRASDLAGYRVWRRSAGGGRYAALTGRPVAENTYSDASAVTGVRYEYAVSAVDKAGNESARSVPVAEILKEPRP